MEWTSDQNKAITENGSDILVSAAAGSGKTAVLVERIIRKLLDEKNPMDIDRMLVVTFTEAAASEMKEKIIRALQKHGGNRANEQLRLAGAADITTIDAFCLRSVKNNFHNIGIDPNFGICDSAEGELMKEEAADALFTMLYKTDNEEDRERFIRLTKTYSSNRNDFSLKEIVLYVHDFAGAFPSPKEWMHEKASMYDAKGEEIFQTVWVQGMLKKVIDIGAYCKNEFASMAEKMAEDCGICMSYRSLVKEYPASEKNQISNAWGKLWHNVTTGLKLCEMLENIDYKADARKAWNEAYETENEIQNGNSFASRVVGTKINKENPSWEEIKSECANLINKGLKSRACILFSADEVEKQFEQLRVLMHDIVWLVDQFDEILFDAKLKSGVFEFDDIEHMTYNLFRDDDIRKEYTDKYDEIFIDEYQDTNGLQDAIFSAISKNNIFMVGDLKQSIYRFRGGDPFIFKDKSKRFRDGDDGKRIALSQNFRSRMEILKSVNSLFGYVMSDRVGDVIYEGDELLNREKDYYVENGGNHKSELHFIPVFKSGDDEEQLEMAKDQLEATYVAKQIRKMIDDKFQITDGTGSRDIQYKDITILASSTKSIADAYQKAFDEQDVPVFLENDGYFDRREIKVVLSLLKLINNHRQDIPLIAVMRSPIGGFSDDELALIRVNHRNTDCFYDAVLRYDGDDELKDKCVQFLKNIDRWRDYMKYKSVAGLLWSLYEETSLYDFMGAFEGGEEAQANMRLLYEKAKQYEETGFKGLFNFIRYIDKLENKTTDISSVKLIGENHNVVRIMTIHKSKGLEFPVVFVVSTGKKFPNSKPQKEPARMNLHKDAGFGMQFVNPEESYYHSTVSYDYIKQCNDDEQKSESLRRLYVALTRPKEKLIITAVKSFNDEESYHSFLDNMKNKIQNGKMSEENASNAGGFYDWIVPTALNDMDNWKFKTVHENFLYNTDVYDILNYTYPYKDCCRLPSKTTVSEIKRRRNDTGGFSIDYSMIRKPSFAITSKEANVVGTAHHQVMAYIEMKDDMSDEYISEEINRICELGQINDADGDNISVDFIKTFFDEEIGKRMIAANEKGLLRREAPFEIAVDASVYEPSLGEEYENDEIIIQGAIDCFFGETDGIVLIDYKTDGFNGDINDETAVQEFNRDKAETYSVQLELYQSAIEKITGKKVKEKYLYLFSTASVVKSE